MENQIIPFSSNESRWCVVFFDSNDEAVAILRNLEYEEAAWRRYNELGRDDHTTAPGGLLKGLLFEEGSVEQFYYSENRGLPELEISQVIYTDVLLAAI